MAKDVKCDVMTCKYQDCGLCSAKVISISNSDCKKAKSKCETACETFELK